jgi:membrane associated rhomboid family serine protease
MIPLKDNNPTSRFPVVTVLLIVTNVAVFLFTDLLGYGGREFLLKYSLIPYNIMTVGSWTGNGPLMAGFSIISSQFLHGGLFHVGGNMLFLWIFGNNIEDRLGGMKFLFFYLLCGVAAATAQIVPDPRSVVPMIGASGAVAGIMGAYLLEFPRARVLTLIWILFFIRLVWLPAFVIIIYWILLQVFFQLASGSSGGGVAYMAHIGGFMAGLILVRLFMLFGGRKRIIWKSN